MKKNNHQKGFTLVEFLIYMGLLSLLVYVMSSLFSATLDTKLESEATSHVDQDTQYILARLTYDMHQATAITNGTSGSTLQLTEGTAFTYTLDGNGNIQLNDGTNTNQINSGDTKITGLTFQHIGAGASTDSVKVQFIITSRTQRFGGQQEMRTIDTTLGLP